MRLPTSTALYQLFLAVLPLMLVSCGARVQISEVPGVYSVRFPGGTERLLLASDGSFIQEVTITEQARSYRAHGAWTFDGANQHISFDGNFLVVLDGRGRIKKDFGPKTNRVVDLGVERLFGKVDIFASDNCIFRKETAKQNGEDRPLVK